MVSYYGMEEIKENIVVWLNDRTCFFCVDNPYIEKKRDIWSNPTVTGESLIMLSVTDKIYMVDEVLDEFTNLFKFQSLAQSDPSLNNNDDTIRFQEELIKFTNKIIKERKEQFNLWNTNGGKIETTNPFAW